MMTTVVDYPAAFEVPSEYDPICDARWEGTEYKRQIDGDISMCLNYVNIY